MSARKAPLADRIQEALVAAGGSMSFYHLAVQLYPERKSHRYQQNGGPPGCYMALSAGITRGGFSTSCRPGDAWSSRMIYAKAKA